MDSLPSEMIGAIFRRMSPRRIDRFRLTSRRHNAIFMENRRYLPKSKKLDVTVYTDQLDLNNIYVTLSPHHSQSHHNPYDVELSLRRSTEGKDDSEIEAFNLSSKLHELALLRRKRMRVSAHTYRTTDLVKSVEVILRNVSLDFAGHSLVITGLRIGDKSLEMLSRSSFSAQRIQFENCELVYRNADNWNRFLKRCCLSEVLFVHTNFTGPPLFTDEKPKIRGVHFEDCHFQKSLEEYGLQNLLRNENIELLRLDNIVVSKEEVLAKMRRFIDGTDMKLRHLRVRLNENDRREIIRFFDSKGSRLCTDTDFFILRSKTRTNTLTISVFDRLIDIQGDETCKER